MAIKRATNTNKRKQNKPKSNSSLSKKILSWVLKGRLARSAITVLWVITLRFINPPFTYLMLHRGFERKEAGKEWKIGRKWLAYEDMSDNLTRAAIAGEDAHFMTHNGFD